MRWVEAAWLLGIASLSRLAQSVLIFVATPRNTLELATGADPLTLTITAPAAFAGSRVFSPSDLSTGPVVLAAPELTGSVNVDQTVDVQRAIWAYDGTADEPTLAWQWRADGVDIPGATGPSYSPNAGQSGVGLSVVETASDAFGARSVASPEITVGA
ncbi:MAG: hypothetical protein AAGJ91_05525 [Pseudomonadota bacterium]